MWPNKPDWIISSGYLTCFSICCNDLYQSCNRVMEKTLCRYICAIYHAFPSLTEYLIFIMHWLMKFLENSPNPNIGQERMKDDFRQSFPKQVWPTPNQSIPIKSNLQEVSFQPRIGSDLWLDPCEVLYSADHKII